MKNSTWLIGILLILFESSFHFNTCVASKKYNRYLAHIFNKYGTGGTMTFEGLEHLMFNLGLGKIEFSPTHSIDEHHPNGYKMPDLLNEDNESLQNLIDEQTIDLLPDNDVQISRESVQKSSMEERMTIKSATATSGSSIEQNASSDDVRLEKNFNGNNFKGMHDPKHRHPRHHDDSAESVKLSSNVCLTPKSLLRLVIDHDDLHQRKLSKFPITHINADDHNSEEEYNQFVNSVKLTPVAFMKLCPALLAQIDQQVCTQPAPVMYVMNDREYVVQAWIYATASIFILSSCGILGILLVPLMKTLAYQKILKFLVAVAVGTLSGDALMHLLPHALATEHNEKEIPKDGETKAHNHNDAVWICACAFFTTVFMYILESSLPLIKGGQSHGHGHSHGHSHSHNPAQPSNKQIAEPNADASREAKEINIMLNEVQNDKKTGSRPLTPVAFMVVIGDGLHNLTDGLAIGAAFASDPVTGMATAFAVLCHELPHELGDFALLLQSGVSIRRAICLNIVSSILSFVGMAVGLLIAGFHTNMVQWIYASTAGSFLYIAFSDLVPTMTMEGNKDVKSTLIQICGILVGGIIMIVIALNEDHLRVIFQ